MEIRDIQEEKIHQKNRWILVRDIIVDISHRFYERSQKIGFWVVVFVCFGSFLTIKGLEIYVKTRIEEAIQLEGFVYKGHVYVVKEDPLRYKPLSKE